VPTVKVFVGKERKLWVLSEEFLCDRVEFFKLMFKSNFKEGHEKEVYLEEDDPETFAKFVDWLFSTFGNVDSLQACKLFVLADKMGVEDLKNSIMSSLEVSHRGDEILTLCPSPEAVKFTYENTTESSSLRKLLVKRMFVFFVHKRRDAADWPEHLNLFNAALLSHPVFSSEVITAIAEHSWGARIPCKYIGTCSMHPY
jgi:hypothetical protein